MLSHIALRYSLVGSRGSQCHLGWRSPSVTKCQSKQPRSSNSEIHCPMIHLGFSEGGWGKMLEHIPIHLTQANPSCLLLLFLLLTQRWGESDEGLALSVFT